MRTTGILILATLLCSPATAQRSKSWVLSHVEGKQIGKQSLGGSGHVIEFETPKGTWYLKSVEIFGQRYGGRYDPRTTGFTVSLCSPKTASLHQARGMYSLFVTREFRWGTVPMGASPKLPPRFRIAVDFAPTQSKGIYLAYGKGAHSFAGLPDGGALRPWQKGAWMIKATLTKKRPRGTKKKRVEKPKGRAEVYLRDFEFIAKTVKRSYPALKKKSVDWQDICARHRSTFQTAADDHAHLRNVHQLLARLLDTHTSVTSAKVEVHLPAFDGLYSGGLWIATEPAHGRILLRAIMPGHSLARELSPGAELIEIAGRPARLALADLRRRLREWHGWSSTHFLDARLSMCFFEFGDEQRVTARFLNPNGKVAKVQLRRYGPGGRSVDRRALTLPDGLSPRELAVARMLDDSIGYVRILGSMNAATQRAFFAALESLRNAKGILLDCRGMGGGGDRAAWAMAGRFFSKQTANGSSRPLVPTGSWQFDGPVVMLQDEREVSSAETFTWAMSETGRVVSVGRPTGGATIIPRVFRLPSGLASFRMGVSDRKTPIRAVQPEGIGTHPDIFVPYHPGLLRRANDPVRWIGDQVLSQMIAGADRTEFVSAVAAMLGGNPPPKKGQNHCPLIRYLAGEFVAESIDDARTVCGDENPMPDFAKAADQLRRLASFATATNRPKLAEKANDAIRSWKTEIAAQRAFDSLGRRAFDAKAAATVEFLERFSESRYGATLRRLLK